MELELLPYDLTICKTERPVFCENSPLWFAAATDRECSLVCVSGFEPADAAAGDAGWKAFRVGGTLDLSLVGILSQLSALLARGGIALFALSTFDTDYLLVRAADCVRAAQIFADAGHTVR